MFFRQRPAVADHVQPDALRGQRVLIPLTDTHDRHRRQYHERRPEAAHCEID